MKKNTKVPVMPTLPKHFTDSMEKVANQVHGRSISDKFAKEWNISEEQSSALLQYLFDTGAITMKWLPEKGQLCFLKNELPN
ncbi:hypothetical protein [Pedobacter sp. MC2016-24]|uniref:hypothetical protein n=1 Tax=Pedobacter sp. MC2016-24 TaxID=2780090 RepID=UPI001880DEF8|nr:hypothetical protein [Pedobacter sp. MC2016-24]MBE9599552.1 hypothetical protein [Pedobacter sp. MC2016-24]